MLDSESHAGRLARAKQYLLEHPESEQAWQWKIQVKVLKFMVNTYGNSGQRGSVERNREHTPQVSATSLEELSTVSLLTCHDEVLTDALTKKLEQAGIPVSVASRPQSQPSEPHPALQILVPAADAERARAVLANSEEAA